MRAALMSKKMIRAPDEAFRDKKKVVFRTMKATSMDIKIVFDKERRVDNMFVKSDVYPP